MELPRPWRFLFNTVAEVESDSAIYRLLVESCKNRSRYEFPEAIDQWDLCQDTGRIEIQLIGGGRADADVEILGTHDGQTFLWGDSNPSVQKNATAAQIRKRLSSDLKVFTAPDRLSLSVRDVTALLSLAAEQLGLEQLLITASGYTVVAMVLENVRIQKASVWKRLRLKKSARHYGSPFDLLNQLLANQVDGISLSPDELLKFEPRLEEINRTFGGGRFEDSLQLIKAVKKDLGEYYCDQEPAGWLLLCEGLCHLKVGSLQAAFESFSDALHATDIPDVKLTRLGIARSAPTEDERKSALIWVFISDTNYFKENGTDEEKSRIGNSIKEAEASRTGVDDNPEAVLRAAISDCYDQELRAFHRSEEASNHRDQSHILGRKDEEAKAISALEYRSLLLKWFTIPCNPQQDSLASDPTENPNQIDTIEIESQTADAASIFVLYKCDELGESRYRYKLRRTHQPLGERELWRISEVWSLWDGEDLRMH